MVTPSRNPRVSDAARALLKQLTPQQKKMVERLRKRHGPGSSSASLSDWYNLGHLAADVLGSERTWGKGVVDGLAELIGCLSSEIYSSRKFAAAYSPQQVARLEGKLSWSWVIQLVAIKDRQERRLIEQECIRNGWSVAELRDRIRTRVGRERGSMSGGRPSRLPSNLSEVLVQLEALLAPSCAGIGPWRGLAHLRRTQRPLPASTCAKSPCVVKSTRRSIESNRYVKRSRARYRGSNPKESLTSRDDGNKSRGCQRLRAPARGIMSEGGSGDGSEAERFARTPSPVNAVSGSRYRTTVGHLMPRPLLSSLLFMKSRVRRCGRELSNTHVGSGPTSGSSPSAFD